MYMDKKHIKEMPEDTLNQQIGVLIRREVEARLLVPLIQALGERFGYPDVMDVLEGVVIQIARQQGADLARSMGKCHSNAFLESLEYWTKDNALKIEVLRHGKKILDFNVTRCRYAEMYQALGVPEMGKTLSCNRDFALIAGFNPEARLVRTQTIMGGAPFCDFRYRFPDHTDCG